MNDLSNSSFSEQLKASELPLDAPEYGTAMNLAGNVFEYVETHRTPPVPKAYEVWYSYASQSDDTIKQRIDVIVESGGVLSAYDIEQIHQEFLSGEAAQNTSSLNLDTEMDGILRLVESYMVSSETYSGSLKSSIEELSDATKPEQIRRTVEVLIAENRRMCDEAGNLASSLEKSKVQINEMRVCLAEAREDGLRDPLTNLANRRKFEQALKKEMAEAYAEKTDLCLVMGDLDHFKRVNDDFGHVVGDGVLKYFASLLTKNVKGRDAAARYGGEEFALVLPHTKVSNAKTLVEQIRSQLEATKLVMTDCNRPLGKITASFGIARWREGDTQQDLIQRADEKLYEAKNSGRNKIVCVED